MQTPLGKPPFGTPVNQGHDCEGTQEEMLAQRDRAPILLIGFLSWKTFMRQWFPENEVVRCATGPILFADFLIKIPRILANRRAKVDQGANFSSIFGGDLGISASEQSSRYPR